MYFRKGDVVLVKIENYPFWPAEIASVLDGELYNVMFYGEKSEAVVDACAVKELTWVRGKALERQAILTKNKKLRVAVRLAMKIVGERGGDHIEGEDNHLSQTIKCRQKGRAQEQDQPKQLEHAKKHIFSYRDRKEGELSPQKMDIQNSPSLPAQTFLSYKQRSSPTDFVSTGKQILRNQYEYDSLRSLLKKYSLGLINMNSYKLTMEEREKMITLLTEKELLLQELIDYWIIEKICSILTFVCFRGISNEAQSKEIITILVNCFNLIKQRIYSSQMDSFGITPQRKQGLISRVRQTDSYLQNPPVSW